MEAGGPLQASVRLLSGGDRDENGDSISQEAQPQNRAQQLQLGGQYGSIMQCSSSHATLYVHGGLLQNRHSLRTQCTSSKVVFKLSSLRSQKEGSSIGLAYEGCGKGDPGLRH